MPSLIASKYILSPHFAISNLTCSWYVNMCLHPWDLGMPTTLQEILYFLTFYYVIIYGIYVTN
jgi:hypothetical protein